MSSGDIVAELTELSRDLRQVVRNLETLASQVEDGAECALPGLEDAREQVESLLWSTGALLFWSNYSIKSNAVA